MLIDREVNIERKSMAHRVLIILKINHNSL